MYASRGFPKASSETLIVYLCVVVILLIVLIDKDGSKKNVTYQSQKHVRRISLQQHYLIKKNLIRFIVVLSEIFSLSLKRFTSLVIIFLGRILRS